MQSRSLLLAICAGLFVLPAAAQSRPGPAYFLRHSGSEPRLGLALPTGPLPAAAPIPTVRAAATYAPLASISQPALPVAAPVLAARHHDLTGVFAYPPYNSYQNLPESFRKHTLPDVYAEPLPLQLLRNALGQPRFGH